MEQSHILKNKSQNRLFCLSLYHAAHVFVHNMFGRSFFHRLIKNTTFILYYKDIHQLFTIYFRPPLKAFVKCPSPEHPTHVSHHWVRWVELYIELSQHFDIEKRPRRRNPVNFPPTLLLSVSHSYKTPHIRHRSEHCWQLLFTYLTKLFKGQISRMEKVGGSREQ